MTLDDLLVDAVIDAATAGAVVAAQLETPARFKPQGEVHPVGPARPGPVPGRARSLARRKARADAAYARLVRAVERHSGIRADDRAERALLTVLGALCRRVTSDEARHLVAQLPSKLHPLLDPYLVGPDRGVTTAAIKEQLVGQLGVDVHLAALILTAVCEAIAESVSAGEIEELRGQLPLGMKDLLPSTPLRRTG